MQAFRAMVRVGLGLAVVVGVVLIVSRFITAVVVDTPPQYAALDELYRPLRSLDQPGRAMVQDAYGRSPTNAIPPGTWTAIAEGVEVRVVSAEKRREYAPGPSGVTQVASGARDFYIVVLEGHVGPRAAGPYRFSTDAFRGLDRHGSVIGPARFPAASRGFTGEVAAGGSLTGEIVFEADGLSGLYFDTYTSYEGNRVYFAVPPLS